MPHPLPRRCSDPDCTRYRKPLTGPDGWTCEGRSMPVLDLPNVHPCNSCGSLDPIVNDAGYCASCASEVM